MGYARFKKLSVSGRYSALFDALWWKSSFIKGHKRMLCLTVSCCKSV